MSHRCGADAGLIIFLWRRKHHVVCPWHITATISLLPAMAPLLLRSQVSPRRSCETVELNPGPCFTPRQRDSSIIEMNEILPCPLKWLEGGLVTVLPVNQVLLIGFCRSSSWSILWPMTLRLIAVLMFIVILSEIEDNGKGIGSTAMCLQGRHT